MLQRLSIKNYALIRELDLEFRKGFTIITGETGAGKSILLGAIHLLLGERADLSALRDPQSKCVLEARFNVKGYDLKSFFAENDLDEETECIIRREIAPNAKSRSFINDTPVNLQQLKTLGNVLIDIHSQHDTLLLNNASFRIQLLDGPAGAITLRKEYSESYQRWKKKDQLLRQLIDQEARIAQERDFISFQAGELREAKLQPNELKQAEEEYQRLSHASEIQQLLDQAIQLAHAEEEGIIIQLSRLLNILRQASRFSSNIQSLWERTQSLQLEMKDVLLEVENEKDNSEADPEKLHQIESRIDLINRLLQKHRLTNEADLILLEQQLNQRLEDAGNLDSRIAEQQVAVDAEFNTMKSLAEQLSQKRKMASSKLEEAVSELLRPLGMPDARIQLEISEQETFDINGKDSIRILFSANKGMAPAEISKIASGGELSRLMLCLKKIMADSVALPTIIFDEIDTGVSGAIADGMGEMLQLMGKELQVISITHLPQIASKGNDHLKVEKSEHEGTTETRIRRLSKDDRIDEIAAMLSGKKMSEAARNNAKALLKIKQ